MALTFLSSKWSLAGFGMGITTALRHDGGKQPGVVVYLEKNTDKAEFGSFNSILCENFTSLLRK